jgi:isoleucyl-tRNA synthetase
VGRSPYRRVLTYEKLLDETGREMHRSWGNSIEVDEALERMGADVMRWLYCEQPPSQNIKFWYGAADEAKRRLLTLWHSASFFVTYAGIESFRPAYAELDSGPGGEVRPLDRWLLARVHELVRDATEAYEAYDTPRVARTFESFVADLSNWYIRRSRRRFWEGDGAALHTLWYGLVQGVRVISPVMPFLSEHLWRALVAGPCDGAPSSVFLAPWPQAPDPDEALLAEIEEARRVVALGHQARGEAGIKLRQPLRRVYVRGAGPALAHADEIAEELRVKEVGFDEGPVGRVQLKPNLPVLGPRLGPKLPEVRAALEAGEYEELGDGRLRAAGEKLGPEDVIRGERVAVEGFQVAEDGQLSVALDTSLDDDLVVEGRVLDVIHRLNSMRKEAGLELTDRIVVTLPEADGELLRHADWIQRETLAVELRVDGGDLQIARA